MPLGRGRVGRVGVIGAPVAKAAVVKNGVDAWIAIGITVGLALGIGSLIFGAVDAFGPLR